MSQPFPLSYLPGVCKVNSSNADSSQGGVIAGRQAIGRITDMDKARFVASLPEKFGGWAKASQEQMIGVPRGMRDWRDNDQNIYTAVGTHKKLYYYNLDAINQRVDITPFRPVMTGTITNKISTTSGSATVNVEHTDHGQQVGDRVILTATSTVGGLTIAGLYTVATVVDADNYTFEHTSLAGSTASNGGGATAYEYYRIVLTDPFATVEDSTTVTVTHAAHGAVQGDYVTFDDAAAVGGLTIDGEYEIMNVSTNSYTITAASAATSTATGGGEVSAQYDISGGLQDSAFAYGYGTGGYSHSSGYGLASTTGLLLNARVWCLYNYGQQLIANPSGLSIYIYDPSVGGRAYQMYGAPAQVLAMVVTPERFVTALGVNGISKRLAWPDQSNYNDWISTAENTANEGRNVQEGNYLVGGIPVRDGVSLLFTDTAPYAHTYTGDQNIYATLPAGSKAGLAGALAVTTLGEKAYWMGVSDFYLWNGATQALPSDDIRDYVFKDINLQQRAKFVAGTIAAKKEVLFFYCSANSTEIDRYVIFHEDQQCFSIGTSADGFVRTSWLDKELYLYPMACSDDGYLFNQEYGVNADGAAMRSFIEMSPIDIAEGAVRQDIFSFVPDFKRQVGDMDLYLLLQDRPQSTVEESGPHDIGNGEIISDLRDEGRLCGFRMISDVIDGDYRMGIPSVEIQPAGARR